MDGIGVLEGFVFEGEGLMVGFGRVEDVETDNTGTVLATGLAIGPINPFRLGH